MPLGPPHSMLAYTADGQVDQVKLDERDRYVIARTFLPVPIFWANPLPAER